MPNKSTEVSVITSYFNSDNYVEKSFDKIFKFCNQISNKKKEIILINDGSQDSTFIILKKILKKKQYKKSNIFLKLINLKNNYGQAGAYVTGMLYAKGKKIFLVEGDFILEKEIELNKAYKKYLKLEKKGKDLLIFEKIFLFRNIFDNFLSFIFWKIYFFTTRIKLKKNICWTRIFNQKLLKTPIQYKNLEFSANKIFLKKSIGYEIQSLSKKYKGFSTYTFITKFKLAIKLIFYGFLKLKKAKIKETKKKYNNRIEIVIKN